MDTNTIKPLRILIIDDDEDDFKIIQNLIHQIQEQSFEIDWCSDYNSGLETLAKFAHDIYFVDYYLGSRTGVDLLHQAITLNCEQPIILLTGKGNKKTDAEALRSGASDYLIKFELTSEQLDRCIRYSIEMSSVLKKLKSSELQFRSIFDKSKDVIFIADSQLEFQKINEAGLELFEYERDEILFTDTTKLFLNPTDKSEIILKLESEMKLIDLPIEFLTKKNVPKDCLLTATKEADEQGNPYVQGIIHDISLFKRMEEVKLQSEKLEAKGTMIRTLAHEIRNPLANINLSNDYLKTSSSQEELEFINIINRNCKQINDLINQLLDSNQFYKLKFEVIDLITVLNAAVDEIKDKIALKKINLLLSYPAHEVLALVDKEKMKIAFLNILVNAAEAMKEGGELSISILSSEREHVINIQDTGCGISEHNMKKLFEPYFTTKSTGLGLGLAAAYGILESHKASIAVSSVLDQGTSFSVMIPAA